MNSVEVKEVKDFLQKSNDLNLRLSNGLKESQEKLLEQKPKVEVFNHLLETGSHENATDLFKKIRLLKNNKEVSRNTAYKFLRDIKVFRPGNTPYIPYAKYFKVVTTQNKAGYNNNTPLFNVLGIEFFIKKVNEFGSIYGLKIEYRSNNNE
jgi:hypothetical protein